MAISFVTEQDFEKEVIRSELPVLLELCTADSPASRAINADVEEVARLMEGKAKVVRVDVDKSKRLAQMLKVQAIPTFIVFAKGRPVAGEQGRLSKGDLVGMLEPHLPRAEGAIKAQELAMAMAEGQVVPVDTREAAAYARAHIPNAVNLPIEEIESRLAELHMLAGEPVLYCRSGDRSKEMSEKLATQGIGVGFLEGGLLAWESSQYPNRAAGLTRMAAPLSVLAERFERALVAAYGAELAGTDPVLRRSDHADFQSNVALALKKRTGQAPRDVATKLVAALDVADVCERVEISGPGFINLQLKAEFLAGAIDEQAADARFGVKKAAAPETVIIDYSSPNIAKEMHVGHLRSTIIGDALARTLAFLGHNVVRQNHLGDWGTPFGMLLEQLLDIQKDVGGLDVADLNAFYRAARVKFDSSPEFSDRARKRVVLLQAGDEATLALWQRLVEESKKHLRALYEKLDVTLKDDDIAGESFFNPQLAGVVRELESKGLAQLSDGALCVFVPGYKNKSGDPLPLIVRKQDGGYGYATSDLAALKHRVDKLGGTRLVYVVGAPQSQHLAMVYKVGEMAGWLAPPARAVHTAFGSVLGEDGKMFAARAGETVKLLDLVLEGEARALELVKQKSAERAEDAREGIAEEDLARVAHAVAIAAIKYADLSSDRVKDYIISWTRMLATEGNTGPYLQYAHARIRSILSKAETAGVKHGPVSIEAAQERALALMLLSFEGALREVDATLEPHKLCTFLHELAAAFSSFYVHCPVLKSGPTDAQRASRLTLVALTARVLAQGLDLLGIEAPERM